MTVAWTSPTIVATALGNPGAAGDPYLANCCDAANAAAYRKRKAAGYTDPGDDGAPAPSPDIAMGATQWAVALWRGRVSTDGFASFDDLQSFAQTFGTWPEIKRLLGIGKGQIDRLPADVHVNPLRHLRRRWVIR